MFPTFAPTLPALPAGTVHETREGWLRAAVTEIEALFADAGLGSLPEVQVSVGWPGGKGKKNNVIGQCWNKASAKDGRPNLFISPVLDDPAEVLATLVHELIHAWDDNASGHRGDFRKAALRLGLEGPMTATVAGEALTYRLSKIAARLGTYPHGAMTYTPKSVGKGRMVKTMCEASETSAGCGFIAYTTRKWLDTYPVQPCACGGEIREV